MEITVRTGKARRTHRRPQVVGYRWIKDVEYEVLACDHLRATGVSGSVDLDDLELDEDPLRRACMQCPMPAGWDR